MGLLQISLLKMLICSSPFIACLLFFFYQNTAVYAHIKGEV